MASPFSLLSGVFAALLAHSKLHARHEDRRLVSVAASLLMPEEFLRRDLNRVSTFDEPTIKQLAWGDRCLSTSVKLLRTDGLTGSDSGPEVWMWKYRLLEGRLRSHLREPRSGQLPDCRCGHFHGHRVIRQPDQFDAACDYSRILQESTLSIAVRCLARWLPLAVRIFCPRALCQCAQTAKRTQSGISLKM